MTKPLNDDVFPKEKLVADAGIRRCQLKTSEILSVGTEILLGEIVNTDAAFIAGRLALLGVSHYYQAAVGDNCGRLTEHIRAALERCDLLILTGGLGPTYDDITKETAAAVMGRKLVLDEKALSTLRGYFASRGRALSPANEKQAYFPEGAEIFYNDHGTAPGCAILDEERGKMIVMLPGPPRELNPMWLDKVEPYLRRFTGSMLFSQNIGVCGMGESDVETVLHDIMVAASDPTVAPYCGEGDVRIRVTARCNTPEEGREKCRGMIEQIYKTDVGPYIYGVDESLEEAAVRLMREKGLRISAAESCTGGLLTKRLTDVPGSSAVLEYSAVTYNERAKTAFLGVPPGLFAEKTVYSPECAEAMARGVMKASGADIGVGITGIAGPDGGTEGVPVGTVFAAVVRGGRVIQRTLNLRVTRQHIRYLATNHALMMVIEAARG